MQRCLNCRKLKRLPAGLMSACAETASSRFGSHSQPFKTPPLEQGEGLEGRALLQVHRVGKHIVCELGGLEGERNGDGAGYAPGIPAAQWIVHLGMTGRLLVTTPEAPVAPHTHARLTMASGREMRFVDARRFGRLEFRLLQRDKPFAGPGVEPLTITPEEFVRLFRGRRLAIKAALLNQTLLHGVGNIYADESLFRAGIRPKRLDYVDAAGVRGFFQLEHGVYMRTGQPCLVCSTPIRRIVLAGRGTHFCPVCQR
jgi:formamidopyrimidine-DNA glycosylase